MSNQLYPKSDEKTDGRDSRNTRRLMLWVGGLTYPQKFILITLIFILPLIAFLPLVFEQSTYIERYGHKEEEGTIYLRDLWQLTDDLQTLQNTVNKYAEDATLSAPIEEAQANIDSSLQALENTHQQYSKSLTLEFNVSELNTQWQNLKSTSQNGSETEHISNLISSTDQATKEVGDLSYLILDPDLDTYYMMDTVLLNMPESQKLLFGLFLVADDAIRTQSLTPEKEALLVVLTGQLETNLNNLDQNIQTALRNNPSGVMKPLVDAPKQNYVDTALSFTNLIKDNLANGQLTSVKAETIEASYFAVRQAADTFYSGSSQALEIGIRTRITTLSTRLYTVTSIAILSILIAFIIGLSTMRTISNPLVQLLSATKQLAAGEMDTRVQFTRNDEIGQVARSFNQMAQELQEDRTTLETRTHEMEVAQKQSELRAKQLQAVTELAASIAQLQDLNELFHDVTTLISERFNFYHVGIFLIDSDHEYAVLQAANSEGGLNMLKQAYRLKLGTGVVGLAASSGQPRIALDTEADTVYFNNPNLPTTRSEVALPLKSRNETIGVLDVQSIEAEAFSSEDLQVLTTLANQVSIAFENARLLAETRAALAQVQEVYNEFTRTEWSHTLAKAEQSGFRYQTGRIEMLENELNTSEVITAIQSGNTANSREKHATVAIPVKLRGEVIGILHIESNDPTREWQTDEVSLVEAVAERAAFAMENARLFQDARRRAAKERLISEATAKISSALDLENILQTTATELERVLGGSEVLIQFQSKEQQ